MDDLTEGWKRLAACADVPTKVFFPAKDDPEGEEAAKAVCASCPVRRPCRTYAEDNNIDEGVWGGEGEVVRRSRRRARRAGQRRMAAPPPDGGGDGAA